MRMRQTTLNPLVRTFAVLALMVFVMAQAMCFVHCNFGAGHGEEVQASCHSAPQPADSHEGDSDCRPSTPSPTAACSTLKTMVAQGDAPTLTSFQTHTLYLLPSLVLALDAIETRPQASIVSQAHSREWTFTPDLCLGPAFRSLAPPFIG